MEERALSLESTQGRELQHSQAQTRGAEQRGIALKAENEALRQQLEVTGNELRRELEMVLQVGLYLFWKLKRLNFLQGKTLLPLRILRNST